VRNEFFLLQTFWFICNWLSFLLKYFSNTITCSNKSDYISTMKASSRNGSEVF
jgi:hypothetical protein